MLAIIDPKNQLKPLQNIVIIFHDDDLLILIKEAGNADEIYKNNK